MKPFDGGQRLIVISLACGVLGAIGLLVGFIVRPEETLVSYLISYCFLFSIAIGAMIFLQTCHAMNAGWPTAIRRPIDAIMAVIPLLAILFIPIFFLEVFPFLHPERITNPVTLELLQHKRPWLNRPLFIGRSIGYLAVFSAIAIVLRQLSLRLDKPGNEGARVTLKLISSATLPLTGLLLTFASFDWIMALSPDFFSTIYGVYFFAGGFLAAIALITILCAAARPWLPPLTRSHWYAFGRLLLSFVIFWAYIAYFQFFLVWIANKPTEAHWFVLRAHGGFAVLSWILGIGQFAVPFFILLLYGVKQAPERLMPIAILLIVVHYIDIYWLIAPDAHHGFSIFDLAALFALTGFSVAFGVFRQRGQMMAPIHDPRLATAIAYESV